MVILKKIPEVYEYLPDVQYPLHRGPDLESGFCSFDAHYIPVEQTHRRSFYCINWCYSSCFSGALNFDLRACCDEVVHHHHRSRADTCCGKTRVSPSAISE